MPKNKLLFLIISLILLSLATNASAAGIFEFFSSFCPWCSFRQPSPTPELLVGSVCHYNNGACFDEAGNPFGTWEKAHLNERHKFFNFSDLKPGDSGEDTISLYAKNADICAWFSIKNVKNKGNFCNEPETASPRDRDCRAKTPGARERRGELGKSMKFDLWLDQGETPGFQGKDKDRGEGDNIFNYNDFLIWKGKHLICPRYDLSLRGELRKVRFKYRRLCNQYDPDGDGNTNYGTCHGLVRDGRLVKSAIYYFGFGWELPKETGNEAQTDSLSFDVLISYKANNLCGGCANNCNLCEWKCKD